MNSLSGKRIMVVGGSSGIGLATAAASLAVGARVCIASRSLEKLAFAAEQLGGVETLQMDIRVDESVHSALTGAGAFDHAVITPGSIKPMRLSRLDMTAALDGFNSKVWGALRIIANMNLVEGGSITLISGIFSQRPARGQTIASCANAAIDALTRALALELAPTRINSISPGVVDTPLWTEKDPDRRAAKFIELAAQLPAGHIGKAQDIADLILACMQNRYITGSVIVADGGQVLV